MDELLVDSFEKTFDAPRGTFLARLLNFLSLIKEECGGGSWVGLYMYSKDKDSLLLGPFQGKEACLEIQPGKGMVGECFIKGDCAYAKDVSALKNYIACDANTKSEYVYPIKGNDGGVVAVFDVDSPKLDGLANQLPLLEKCGEILERFTQEILDCAL